jgi:EAL domain-containing protein (putative c-di-GMP-specific phosphodiesterase class I)
LFAHPKDLPVDLVKSDGRRIRDLGNSNVDQTMIKAMNDVAHAMSMELWSWRRSSWKTANACSF